MANIFTADDTRTRCTVMIEVLGRMQVTLKVV